MGSASRSRQPREPVDGDAPVVALVLAGGGARGAYEFGALRVLLPELERLGLRPAVIVGTSVGALNAAFLSARAHEPAARVVERGAEMWQSIDFERVLAPIVSRGALTRVARYLGEALEVPGARLDALLDPTPLRATLRAAVSFRRLARNVEDGVLRASAVVATSAHSSRSIVFHDGGGAPPRDDGRGIDDTPAVPPHRPDAIEAAGQLVQAVLVDPLAHDVSTLATLNDVLPAAGRDDKRRVPYIFVAPGRRGAIGEIARDVFERHYSHLADVIRKRDLALLGHALASGADPLHGELFSYLFFAPEFTAALLDLGARDAQAWLDSPHDDGPWQLHRLPTTAARGA